MRWMRRVPSDAGCVCRMFVGNFSTKELRKRLCAKPPAPWTRDAVKAKHDEKSPHKWRVSAYRPRNSLCANSMNCR